MIQFYEKGEKFDLPLVRQHDATQYVRAVWIEDGKIQGVGYADPAGNNPEHDKLLALVWLFRNMTYLEIVPEDERRQYEIQAKEALSKYENENEFNQTFPEF